MIERQHPQTRALAVGAESALHVLDQELNRHRTRARRTWRNYQAIDEELDAAASAAAHRVWSDAVDDALRVAEAISRERPRDLGELLIQFEATWWWLIEDDSVLDGTARRWLRRFRRSLRQLAAKT